VQPLPEASSFAVLGCWPAWTQVYVPAQFAESAPLVPSDAPELDAPTDEPWLLPCLACEGGASLLFGARSKLERTGSKAPMPSPGSPPPPVHATARRTPADPAESAMMEMELKALLRSMVNSRERILARGRPSTAKLHGK
jgi:hypothetical protein